MKRIIIAIGVILSIVLGAPGVQAAEDYLYQPHTITPTNMPVGSIILWPTNNDLKTADDAEEWMICDGRQLPIGDGWQQIQDYKPLWEHIGSSFGLGVDPRTFKIPDLRGMFVRGTNTAGKMGKKGAPWYDPNAAQRTPLKPNGIGDEVGSQQTSQNLKHTHSAGMQAVPSGDSYTVLIRPDSNNNKAQVGETGGEESRPINVYLNYLIKVKQKSLAAK